MPFNATPRLRLIALAGAALLTACSSGPVAQQSSSPIEGPSPPTTVTPTPGVQGLPSASGSIALTTLGGRIAFSNDTEDIWVVNADGSGLRRLTTHPAHDFDPAWSPDGTQLAFRSKRDGNNEVYVMNADGSRQRNVSRDPADDWGPTWSPRGTVLWNCARSSTGSLRPCISNSDGTRPGSIPVDIFFEYPAWSPDGNRIAFMSMEPGARGNDPEYNVYVMNADGTGLKQLTDSPGQDGYPAWSPDGSRIAFSSTRDDCGNSTATDCKTTGDIGPFHTLYVMNADGSNQRRLTDTFGQFMDWSPDGRYLVFSPGLNVIRSDGSGLLSLDVAVSGPVFPDWGD